MLPGRHPARRADAAGTGPLLPAATRAAVAEFVATAIFVFAAEGSVYGLCTPTSAHLDTYKKLCTHAPCVPAYLYFKFLFIFMPNSKFNSCHVYEASACSWC
jgi:aquaporin TIP